MQIQQNAPLPLPKGMYLNDPAVFSDWMEPYDHWAPTSATVEPGQPCVLRGWVAVKNTTSYTLQMSTRIVQVKPGYWKTLLEIKGSGPEGSFILHKHIRIDHYSIINPYLSIQLQATEKGTSAVLVAHKDIQDAKGNWIWKDEVLKEALLEPSPTDQIKRSFRKLSQFSQKA